MQHWNQVQLELVRRYVQGEITSVDFSYDFVEARDHSITSDERQEPVTFLLDDAWYDIDNHLPDEYVGGPPDSDSDLTREPGEMDDEQLRESLARRLRDWDAGTYAPKYDD